MIDEVIKTKNGKYLLITEVSPINFGYKSTEDKEIIIANFASWLKIAPIKMRIKTISKTVNTNKYIKTLKENFENEQNATPGIVKYRADYIDLIRTIGRREGVEKQILIIFEYRDTELYIASDEYSIVDQLRRAKITASKFLRSCGNEIIEHENETDFVLETIFKIMNRNMRSKDLWNKVEKIKDNVVKYYDNDEDELQRLEGYYDNILAPNNVEFYRDYCVVDGLYYTFLLVPSNGYRIEVPAAWTSFLINFSEGVDVDIWIEKKDKSQTKNKIRRRKKLNRVAFNEVSSKEGEDAESMATAIESASFIQDALTSGEDFYYINMMITISSPTLIGLQKKQMAVRDALTSVDMKSIETPFSVQEALLCYMPTQMLLPDFFNATKRNVTTSGLASFYPFASFEVSDNDGVVIGVANDNQSMVVTDIFNQRRYSNANMVILGTSGSGKTFTMQTMLMRHRLKGIQVFVIAPDKGEEFIPSTKALDGTYINIASGGKQRINIMDIRPVNDFYDNDRFVSRRKQTILLNQKIENLATFFSLIIPDMSLEERELLDKAIIKTYNQKGITKDNKSLIDHYEFKENKKVPVYKEMPILEDLYNVLITDDKTKRLATILHRYVFGSASAFNGHTNVDLDNKYIVVDITDLSETLRPIGMFVALEYIWDKVREDKTQKKIVAIDEAWELLSTNELAASFMKKIFKTIRGYGGSAWAATQNIKDFFALNDGAYGEAIINNSRLKMILRLETKEVQTIQEVFELSNEEAAAIKTFSRGKILVKANSNTFSVTYKASPFETLLTTTDRALLEKIANGIEITEEDLIA